MAIVSEQAVYVQPQAYFGVAGSILPELKLESGSLSAQIDNWSKVESGARVTKINPSENHMHLSNGKKFTYKALVLAPGLEHTMDGIKGLKR